MSQVLPLVMWVMIVGELLVGLGLAGKAAKLIEREFYRDYAMQVCGQYLAMEANLRSAVTTWRKIGCANEEDAESEIEDFLEDWRDRFVGFDAAACADEGPLHVRIRREKNPALDRDYPNWVVKYE